MIFFIKTHFVFNKLLIFMLEVYIMHNSDRKICILGMVVAYFKL